MTIIVRIDPKIEARLQEKAGQQGQDLPTYIASELERIALPAPERSGGRITPAPSRQRRTGAEIVAEWEREGIPSVYARYPDDSPDLARKLRMEAEARLDGQLAAGRAEADSAEHETSRDQRGDRCGNDQASLD
ncbi:MAG TPA: hypothetical protein VFJ58_29105 [Armatimonadota bacterium]|nr:hypothetical protein [Armatimonadota bacterium]